MIIIVIELLLLLVPEKHKFSGTNQKPERRRPFGTGPVRHCPQGLFSPFFTFLRATFSRPFRLSLASTICPWVSEDVVIQKFGYHGNSTSHFSSLFLSEFCHFSHFNDTRQTNMKFYDKSEEFQFVCLSFESLNSKCTHAALLAPLFKYVPGVTRPVF